MPPNGHWPDLLEVWLEYTADAESPEIFRLWSGIAMIAGVLERRVWTRYRSGSSATYPGLYTLLVAPPGVGKQVVNDVREIWSESRQPDSTLAALHVASQSVSKASMVDELAAAKQIRLTAEGPPLVYHSLLVAAEEFSVLMPTYDPTMVSILNGLFNPSEIPYRETRRTSIVKKVEIQRPILNILGATQPAYLANTFPEDIWNTGIARRFIMIWAPEGPLLDIFAEIPDKSATRTQLLQMMGLLAGVFGQMRWTTDAAERVRAWHLDRGPPQPTHSKLVHYLRSRSQFLIKLSIISAMASRMERVIRLSDVERALGWLISAESVMPDIFRAMVGKSDFQVINELHEFTLAWWAKEKGKKAIPGQTMRGFLMDRVPAQNLGKIIEVAESSGVITRDPPGTDLWRPRARPSQTE